MAEDSARNDPHLSMGVAVTTAEAGNDRAIADASEAAATARAGLASLIANLCPGPHDYVQHRDRRPAWCETCRYTINGVKIEGTAS